MITILVMMNRYPLLWLRGTIPWGPWTGLGPHPGVPSVCTLNTQLDITQSCVTYCDYKANAQKKRKREKREKEKREKRKEKREKRKD